MSSSWTSWRPSRAASSQVSLRGTQKRTNPNNIVARARIVIVGDAFLTIRSKDLLRAIRPDVPMSLLDNVHNPYKKTLELVEVMSGGPGEGGGRHKMAAEKAAPPKYSPVKSIAR